MFLKTNRPSSRQSDQSPLFFLDTIIDTVLDGLKSTNQSLAYRVIIPRSVFKIVAAVCGFSTIIYRLVSSANSLILE